MGRPVNKIFAAITSEIRGEVGRKFDIRQIQSMEKKDLLQMQAEIGYGSVWGTIDVPACRLPPGKGRTEGTRAFVISKHLRGAPSTQELENFILVATRYVLLGFLAPQTNSTSGKIMLSDASITTVLRHFCRLANHAMQQDEQRSGGVICRLSSHSANVLCKDIKLRAELNRIKNYYVSGYWSDIPQKDVVSEVVDYSEKLDTSPQVRPIPFQPFPDEFIGALGWRCAWLVENITPSVLRLLEIMYPNGNSWKSQFSSRNAFSVGVKKLLLEFEWLDKSGCPITVLPFYLDIQGTGAQKDVPWPPVHYSQIKVLVGVLQASNLSITLTTTGGRISECLSLNGKMVSHSVDNIITVEGKTYKLIFDEEGQERDWPLAEIAEEALKGQVRLMRYFQYLNFQDEMETEGVQTVGKSIWAQVGSGKELYCTGSGISELVRRFGIESLLGDTNPNPHRFRKTLARIVGLALVGAPKILMDLFGHRQIEMALGYMLSNPAFRAEIEEMANAETIMNASSLLADVKSAGGPAAHRVKNAFEAEAARSAKDLEEIDLESLADTFTMGGKQWLLVREGVVCIKAAHEVGPCSKARGNPDPASCQSDCGHRLEHGFLKQDVEAAILEGCAQFEKCEREHNILGMAEWSGQIQANINRFPEIQEQFANHSTVKRALKG